MHNTPTEPHVPQGRTFAQSALFFFVFVGTVALTYGFFYIIDFLPEKKNEVDTVYNVTELSETDDGETVVESPLPVSIIFDTLDGKEVTIQNPESGAVDVLDEALLKGVVRYPDSADFANPGTIFLLGHSSYLPVVHNKNFQAFNGIQKLEWGDTIRLRSQDTEYVYSVERVYQAKATDAEVEIEHGTPTLVLATCNSFATKDDRYVVEASFVGSHGIGQENQ